MRLLATITGLLVLTAWAVGAAAAVAPADSAAAAAPSVLRADSLAAPAPPPALAAKIDLWSTGVSPTGAVLMTPLFPGWGQLYTEGGWRATLAFGAEMWFWSRLLTRDQRAVRAREFADTFAGDDPNYAFYNAVAEEDWEQMRDFAWWSGGALLIIALDAYVGAHLFHFDQDPVPVPNRWDEEFGPPGGDLPGLSAVAVPILQCRIGF